jgi:hypothetical protein
MQDKHIQSPNTRNAPLILNKNVFIAGLALLENKQAMKEHINLNQMI